MAIMTSRKTIFYENAKSREFEKMRVKI